MKEWIVREGETRGEGRYLWGLEFVRPYADSQNMHYMRPRDLSGKWEADWDVPQRGARRFARIDEASLAARRAGGRIVRLRSKLPL